MRERVLATIKKYNMIEKGDKVVMGVSGGADSVALLILLHSLRKELDLTLFAVHVNHGIRGDEAKRDENFVKDICKELDIGCVVKNENIPEMAKKFGITEEEAGRQVRYEAFYECMDKNSANKIAVAHNLNDQAETMIMRLCRGTGLTGLRGISPVRDSIIRPLIDCTRKEIEAWLKEEKQEFCIDSTNLMAEYTRNKIRLNLLPYIEKELNTGVINNLAKTAQLLTDEDDYIEAEAKKAYEKVVEKETTDAVYLKISGMVKLPQVIQRRIVRRGFRVFNKDIKDLTLQHITSVLNLMEGNSGRRVNLIGGLGAQKEYEYLKLTKNLFEEEFEFYYELKEDIPVFVKEAGIYAEISKKVEENAANSHYVYTKAVDCDKINDTLVIRCRKPLDTISINKHGGSKKLKNFFIDEKIPRDLRQKVPVVACNNKAVWVVGYRCGADFVADNKTENVLYIHVWEDYQ